MSVDSIQSLLHQVVEKLWHEFDVNMIDLDYLISPDILSLDTHGHMINVDQQMVKTIRKVPTFLGKFRDQNIIAELFSALKRYHIIMVYGIGHLYTIKPVINYLSTLPNDN